MNNLNTHRKSKWAFLVIGGILALSIVLNLFLYFKNANSILDRTHKIDKKITNDGITWVGINVQQNDITGKLEPWDDGNFYELWHVDRDGNMLLLENFPMNFASTVAFEVNKKRGVDVSYYTGGPEGGTTTDFFYDYEGIEKLRIEDETSQHYMFTFKQGMYGYTYTVSTLIAKECLQRDDEVTLKGLKMSINGGLEKEYLLAKPEKVKCTTSTNGDPINPELKERQFDDESIKFMLPNDQKVSISLLEIDDGLYFRAFPKVKFE